MSSACRGSNGAIPPAGDGVVATPGPQAPGPPTQATPGPQAPGPPTQAPVARVPRCFPWYFKHSPEIALYPYI